MCFEITGPLFSFLLFFSLNLYFARLFLSSLVIVDGNSSVDDEFSRDLLSQPLSMTLRPQTTRMQVLHLKIRPFMNADLCVIATLFDDVDFGESIMMPQFFLLLSSHQN